MIVATLVRHCAAAAVVLGLAYAADARAEYKPLVGWDQQLFPSYLIATATVRPAADAAQSDTVLGDPRGVIAIEIVAPSDDCQLTVTVSGEPAFEASTFTGTLPSEGKTYRVVPQIKYDYAALAQNKQSVPLPVHFSVKIGDDDPVETTVTATLRSVNDCPFAIGRGKEAVDVSFTFAAYVNEQHPFVEKILREALDGDVVDSFTGYQSGNPQEVYRQAYALWDALSRRDIRYADITVMAAENRVVSSQHVRLIDESINNSQANCVDGSVLLASLLRKIGIEPMLVFVPGHCYLGFYLDNEGKKIAFLETTLLGSSPPEELPNVTDLQGLIDSDSEPPASWGTFVNAIAMGAANFIAKQEKFAAGGNSDYQLVPIGAARRQGILPIAFEAGEDFVPAEKN